VGNASREASRDCQTRVGGQENIGNRADTKPRNESKGGRGKDEGGRRGYVGGAGAGGVQREKKYAN